MWYPWSSVVLDCIDSWSLPSILLLLSYLSHLKCHLCDKIIKKISPLFHANQILYVLVHIWTKGWGWHCETGLCPSKIFLLTVPMRYFFCGSFVLFVSCDGHAFASVHCCLAVTCLERADLLALVCDVYCGFVTFPCGILGQVWYLIVLIPDLYHLSYFYSPIFLT